MSIKSVANSTWIDDQGLKLGFIRFDNESVKDYRKRVIRYLNNLPENTEEGFINSQNLELGYKDKALFEIHLKTYETEDFTWNVPEDPRVAIDANFIRIWSNYKENKENPDLEIDLTDRDKGYFLEDIWSEINKLDFIEVKPLDRYDNWKYLKSRNLKWSNSLKFFTNQKLNTTQTTMLSKQNIELHFPMK